MLFDWSTFFLCFLSIYFFSMTPLSLCKITRREISLDFEYWFWRNSRCTS
jgi:hypothetical protein